MVLEIVITILAVCGVLMLIWCVTGRMLRPAGGQELLLLYPAHGAAEGLEHAARGIAWLRETGLCAGEFYVVDCGLDAQGRQRLALLCERLEFVHLIPEAQLPEILRSER